jgi:hypothetical protein
MAQPHHRHQVSLKSVLDFLSITASLSADERSQATLIFYRIINYCSSHELLNTSDNAERKYRRAKLVKLIYEYVISNTGRDNILRYFLASIVIESTKIKKFPYILATLIDFDNLDISKKESIIKRVRDFADHLVNGFFLLCK